MQIKETYFLEVGMTLDTLSKSCRRTFFHLSVVTNISLIFIFKAFKINRVVAVSGKC